MLPVVQYTVTFLAAFNTKPVRSKTPFGAIVVPYSIASLATVELGPVLAPTYSRIVAGVVALVLVKLTLITLYVLLGTVYVVVFVVALGVPVYKSPVAMFVSPNFYYF
jgi:hypothetical protein